MNNAWRQKVSGVDNIDVATAGISIKSSPSGGELIVNGNFGGDVIIVVPPINKNKPIVAGGDERG